MPARCSSVEAGGEGVADAGEELAAGGAVHKGDAAAGVVVEKHLAADCVRATIIGGGTLNGIGLSFAGESLL